MEEIRKLAEKKGKFSKADIALLIEEGAKVGVEPPENTSCSSCWRDMAVRIWAAVKPKATGVRLRGDAARDGVVHMGRLIMNPLDEETLEWMEAHSFPKQLLEGYAEN